MSSDRAASDDENETRSKGTGGCLKALGCGCAGLILLCVLGTWLANRWMPFLGRNFEFAEHYHLAEDRTSHGDAFFFGQDVVLDGVLDGDLSMMGEKLEVNGTIEGDVVFLGARLRNIGTINGDLRFTGERCRIEGTVTGDVDFTGEELIIAPGGLVQGNLEMLGDTFTNEGTVEGSINGATTQ